jgi:hypothetical protein
VQDARSAMPIRTAIRENMCFFIAVYVQFASGSVFGRLKSKEPLGMLVVPHRAAADTATDPGRGRRRNAQSNFSQIIPAAASAG